jgi:hypothetical protein
MDFFFPYILTGLISAMILTYVDAKWKMVNNCNAIILCTIVAWPLIIPAILAIILLGALDRWIDALRKLFNDFL